MEGKLEVEEQVSIIVKNVSSRFADVHLSTPLHWNVMRLKEELIQMYEGNLETQQLKLIFGGQLLLPDSILSQIFQSRDLSVPQTIYLVISQTANSPTSSSSSPSGIQFRFQARQQQNQEEQRPALQRPVQEEREQQGGEERGNQDNSTLWTILKLAFMVYVLSQGGGLPRLAILSWVALVIFLVQTGRLRMFTQIPFNIPHLPTGEGRSAQPQQEKTWFQEIEQLVIPFFFSLFPNWQLPQSLPPPQQDQHEE